MNIFDISPVFSVVPKTHVMLTLWICLISGVIYLAIAYTHRKPQRFQYEYDMQGIRIARAIFDK